MAARALILALLLGASQAQAKPPVPAKEIKDIPKEDILKTLEHMRAITHAAEERADAADAHAATAAAALQAADGKADALQAEVNVIARQAARVPELEAKVRAQTALAWKWRLVTTGLVLLVAAFFVARQYFPILKFI